MFSSKRFSPNVRNTRFSHRQTESSQTFELWHLEEVKHDDETSDSDVADVARKIGVVNKQRNALIDEIDEFLDEARRLLRWIRSAFALIFCNRTEI